MKKFLALIICLCILTTTSPLSMTAFAGEVGEEFSDTIYEEPSEEPSEEPVSEDTVIEAPASESPASEAPIVENETEAEIDSTVYGNETFDDENAAQLASEYVLDEIIIKFVDSAPGMEDKLQKEIEKLEKIGFVEVLGVFIVKTDELAKNPNAVLNKYKNNKFVEYVEPNYIMKFDYIPNDPSYKTNQVNTLNIINALTGWDFTTGDGGPVIAIVDSGVATHSDLPVSLSGYSAVSSLLTSYDRVGHGTNVAGVIGAIGDNGTGGAGLNWNANILPIKADDSTGALTIANVAKGIIWAADNGARIINLSLGSTSDSTTLRNAIDYAYNKGCAIFAAAGNSGINGVEYPARYQNVMAVGSSASGTSRSPSSNYGADLDIVALNSYYTTTTTGGYMVASGTSFATPQAAALASLIWSLNPSLSNSEIYAFIEQGAKPLGGGYNDQTGHGLIDIGNTLKIVAATSLPAETSLYPTPPIITLNSFIEQSIFMGEVYQEMGFTAVDCLGKDITAKVVVTSTVNTAKVGLYAVTYTVSDDGGNTAKVTRIVKVVELPAALPAAPTITVIGSNPILLHLSSGTLYKEQGAKAVDTDGTDLSGKVQITGQINRNVAGTYTITYTVVGKNGNTSSTTRDVRILAPDSETIVSKPYGFSGQGRQSAKITHTNIIADAFGYMNLKLASVSKNMTIRIDFVNSVTKQVVFTDTLSAMGSKQYKIDEGVYQLVVTIVKANGNSTYKIDLLMPEVAELYFSEEEIPLGNPLKEIPLTGEKDSNIMLFVMIDLALISCIIAINVIRKSKAS